MITDMVPSIVDTLTTYHDYNYQDYIKLLETITFDDFLDQLLDPTCTYMWCGLLPEETITDLSATL